MEKEKKNNLIISTISVVVGAIIGASIPLIVNKIKFKKQKETKEDIANPESNNEMRIEKNIKEANEVSKSVDQLFLVPIKKEYIERIGFGVIGAIKTLTGEDENGKYNSRIIVGLNAMIEVKEYNGKIEGFKVFKNDNDARLYINKFITDKNIINSKNKEECMKRLFKLLEDNKKYEDKTEN